jgi:hypothetical protein
MYISLAAITCPAAVVYAEDGMWRKAQLFRQPFFKPHLFTVPWALSVSLSASTSPLENYYFNICDVITSPEKEKSSAIHYSRHPSRFLSPPRTGEASAFKSDWPNPPRWPTPPRGVWPKENFWEIDTVDNLGITHFTTVWEAPQGPQTFLPKPPVRPTSLSLSKQAI